MFSSPPNNQRNFLILVMAVAMAASVIPFMAGLALTPPGHQFFGNSALNAWDPGVYYSYIEQGRTGGPFMSDLMTSELYAPTLFQPVWWILGRLAELFGLSNPMIFMVTRWLFAPVMVGAIWWAVKWMTTDWAERRIALIIAMFAGGLGGWLAWLHQNFYLTLYPDLWVAEVFPSLTLLSSPHFLLVTGGTIVALVAVERAWRETSRRLFWLAATATLATLLLHPFHLITWIILWVGLTLIRTLQQRGIPWHYIRTWVGTLVVASPAILLYGLQLWLDPLVVVRAEQNINQTWPWPATFVLLGIIGPLAVAGAWRRRHHYTTHWLIGLAGAYLIAVNLPFAFQRRLSHGLFIPFAFLAVPVLADWWRRLRSPAQRWLVGTLGLIILAGSWLRVDLAIIQAYGYERSINPIRGSFVPPDERDLINWLRLNGQRDRPLLAALTTSRTLAGLAGQRVFVAHNVETVNFVLKQDLMQAFYRQLSVADQRRLITDYRLCYILDGPRERTYGYAFNSSRLPELIILWASPVTTLFQTPEC